MNANLSMSLKNKFLLEAERSAKAKHLNVIKTYGAFANLPNPLIVMGMAYLNNADCEELAEMDLKNFCKELKSQCMSLSTHFNSLSKGADRSDASINSTGHRSRDELFTPV